MIILFIVIFLLILFLSIIYFNNIIPPFSIPLNNDETDCKTVSSRGILKSCDIYSKNPISSITNLVNYDFTNIINGSIIYICCDSLSDFIENYLPNIQTKFILVTGDGDIPMPNNFTFLLNDHRLIHWFSQNLTLSHNKSSHIPIGLDFHTLSDNEKKSSPLHQEQILKNIYKKSPPFYKRILKAYSNFHFNYKNSKYGYDRDDAIKNIPSDSIYYEPFPLIREKSWENQVKYTFVVSPHGNGLDCHRTWEALALGCIVIVKTSCIDTLYDDLPVLIVNEWNQVTKEKLEQTVHIFSKKQFNYDKLNLKYWINKIKNKKLTK